MKYIGSKLADSFGLYHASPNLITDILNDDAVQPISLNIQPSIIDNRSVFLYSQISDSHIKLWNYRKTKYFLRTEASIESRQGYCFCVIRMNPLGKKFLILWTASSLFILICFIISLATSQIATFFPYILIGVFFVLIGIFAACVIGISLHHSIVDAKMLREFILSKDNSAAPSKS